MSATRSAASLLAPMLTPTIPRRRPRREPRASRLVAVVVEAQRLISAWSLGKPEQPRPGIARLRPRRQRADLDEAEARASSPPDLGVLVEARREAERIGETRGRTRRWRARRRARPSAETAQAAPRSRPDAPLPAAFSGEPAAPDRRARVITGRSTEIMSPVGAERQRPRPAHGEAAAAIKVGKQRAAA